MSKDRSPVFYCYRAIVAQVNSLDALSNRCKLIKDIYEDLAELACFMMEGECKQIISTIKQMQCTLGELEEAILVDDEKNMGYIRMILTELFTHMEYLLIEYKMYEFED